MTDQIEEMMLIGKKVKRERREKRERRKREFNLERVKEERRKRYEGKREERKRRRGNRRKDKNIYNAKKTKYSHSWLLTYENIKSQNKQKQKWANEQYEENVVSWKL